MEASSIFDMIKPKLHLNASIKHCLINKVGQSGGKDRGGGSKSGARKNEAVGRRNIVYDMQVASGSVAFVSSGLWIGKEKENRDRAKKVR